MSWRSVIITRPSYLRLHNQALVVEQDDGSVRVPLDDMATLLIEHKQVTLTSHVLSECASRRIAVITVGGNYHPNGVSLPYLSHGRALKVMRAQLEIRRPLRKQLWRNIISQKIYNQAQVLKKYGDARFVRRVEVLARDVRSGDSGHSESQASRVYFPAIFGKGFTRKQKRFHNAALDYGYAIIRAAIARSLVTYGFLTAFGLHHRSEQNSFNLADDLIEPFRPLLDAYVLDNFSQSDEEGLSPRSKAILVGILHKDVGLSEKGECRGTSSLLAAVDEIVMSLSRRLEDGDSHLTLPIFRAEADLAG